MKKLIKILPIIMVVMTVLTTVTPVFADKIGDVVIEPSKNSAGEVQNLGNQILGIIRVVGTIIAVGVLMVIGIKNIYRPFCSRFSRADYPRFS